MPQAFRAQVVPEQAPGGRMRARRRRHCRQLQRIGTGVSGGGGDRRPIASRGAAAAVVVGPAHDGHTVCGRHRSSSSNRPPFRGRRLTAIAVSVGHSPDED